MNAFLSRSFKRGEVEAAMYQIGPFKAPGPNGFEAYFYQNFWGTMGDDVVQAALNFLEGEEMEEIVNFTHSSYPQNKRPSYSE